MEIKKGNVIINIDEVIDKPKRDVIELNAEVLDMLIKRDVDLIYGYFMMKLSTIKNALKLLPGETDE